MRVVNLARKPFVNRRPIRRVAALLWLIGAVLLLVNLQLYVSHWRGVAENRRQLAAVERALDERSEIVAGQRRQLDRVNLRARNARALFLNNLISYRTFPWSSLFDSLEEVLPDDVRLVNVQPVVKLASELSQERRESRENSRGSASPATSRRRETSRRAQRETGRETEEAPTTVAPEEPDALAPDEVRLQLTGVAQSDEALLDFVDALFANPAFRRPVLERESLERTLGPQAKTFTLGVVYLTHVPGATPPVQIAAGEEGEPDDAAAGAADASQTAAVPPDGTAQAPAQPSSDGTPPAAAPPSGSVPDSLLGTAAGEALAQREALAEEEGPSTPPGRRTPAESRPRARERRESAPAAGVVGVPPGTAAQDPSTNSRLEALRQRLREQRSQQRTEPRSDTPSAADPPPSFRGDDASSTPRVRSRGARLVYPEGNVPERLRSTSLSVGTSVSCVMEGAVA